jgi:hypothetical protein
MLVCAIVPFFFVLLRCYVRWHLIHNFGADDAVAVIAWVSDYLRHTRQPTASPQNKDLNPPSQLLLPIFAALNIRATQLGLGRHIGWVYASPTADLDAIGMWVNIGSVFINLSNALGKTAVALTLLRLIKPASSLLVWLRRLLWFAMGSINLLTIIGLVIAGAQCHGDWDHQWADAFEGRCWPGYIFTDFYLVAGGK